MSKENLLSFTLEEFEEMFSEWGEANFRAKQLFSWLHQKQCFSVDDMSNLPAPLRERLKKDYTLEIPQKAEKQVSQDGTVKYLFELADGSFIETVLMRYKHGNTICLSTQVGCRMGCRFCASTQGGLLRNLSAGEIIGQVYAAEQDTSERVGNVVLMGIGEPLDNMRAVLNFIGNITNSAGHDLGMRGITLSTCGIVPKINLLAQEKLGITLSVSLHAATDEKRSAMMPINNQYPISELLQACREYKEKTGRRVSFEYAMIKGVNDTKEDAKELAKLLKNSQSHVNLIPVNPVDGTPYSSSDDKNIHEFQKLLLALGVNATVRRRLGVDIDAACGQLRRQAERRHF